MTYATLMVHLELNRSNAAVLHVAADWAERFGAHVVGIAASLPMPLLYGEGYVPASLYEQNRELALKETKAAEAEFHAALQGRTKSLAWRTTDLPASLASFIAAQARCADAVITSAPTEESWDFQRSVNLGDLIMELGRPLLVVPKVVDHLKLDRIVVGWNDSCESRQALINALPLLQKSQHVVVVELATQNNITIARQHVEDVVAWLDRHSVVAEMFVALSGDSDAQGLYAVAQDQGAGIIVAGAYGHSRLREWAAGGVTRDLLLRPSCCSLVSH